MFTKGPIGVFDSGYGGLTVLKEIVKAQPGYDYIYLGDNARAPYGNRSFNTIYQYTLQCVKWFFSQQCPLVILACNTASAKALRTIQQKDLPLMDPDKRVLGVIRPTTEIIGQFSTTGRIGILATQGTVQSGSYQIEIEKFYPHINVFQQACPLWVPLIENGEFDNEGADYFIQKYVHTLLQKAADIDTILLACTHYPLIQHKIKQLVPPHVNILSQGPIVAASLSHYLKKHTEIESSLTRNGTVKFFTTDATEDFDAHATLFYGRQVHAAHVEM